MRRSPFPVIALCAGVLLAACTRTPEAEPATPAAAPVAAEPAQTPAPAASTIDESILEEASTPGSDNSIPKSFHGTWDESEQACQSHGEGHLVLTANEVRYHEGLGKVERVQVPRDGEIVLRLAMRGEGEQWASTERFALSPDGSELYDLGQEPAFSRVRCR